MLIVAAVALAAILLCSCACLLAGGLVALRGSPLHVTVERLLGYDPNRPIERYLGDVRRGNRSAALAEWEQPARSAELQARRISVTDTLLSYGPGQRHELLDRQWWRTCCEPGLAAPDNAGLMRARVRIVPESGDPVIYVFDVQTVQRPYWGAAGGDPIRRWTLVDVYREGEAPLAFPCLAAGNP